jgi:hypothetical protein
MLPSKLEHWPPPKQINELNRRGLNEPSLFYFSGFEII